MLSVRLPEILYQQRNRPCHPSETRLVVCENPKRGQSLGRRCSPAQEGGMM